MAAIIELKNISFSAQNQAVVRDFSCQFEEGKTTALVGPSGGGKSTVLKLAAGLLIPTGGDVFFRGRNIAHMSRKENLNFRREGAVVFQDSALWANQDLYQILELPLRVHFPGMPREERTARIQEVLRDVGYKKELTKRPAMLSMGEQKLIAFARAILCHPTLLFLDEWTESLDDTAAQQLIALVKRRQEAHNTIIFVNHDFNIIRDLADYVFMVLGGQLFLKLTREQITRDDNMARYIEKGIAS
ncbi:MAG: ATP-binding cassette domain-containing protein [Spirochaetaceae bacterium]|jgi:ABC-type transporter Mla maintaining outer membrane lipid asymmetry ATPase subunit MlaF|nr:ATP-binding cassette domain-containing protein [Spirochaetaceae bacterium]